MLAKGLLWKKLQQLTIENTVFPSLDSKLLIPRKYHFLFPDMLVEEKVAIKDIAEVVDNVLLREEERIEARLDKFGRFDHNKSILVRNGLDQSPIIDELVLDVIKQLNLTIKTIWSEGKKAVVCLTHDVDAIDGFSYFWLRKINWYWQRIKARLKGDQQIANAWASTLEQWQRYKKTNFDPMDSFEQIQALEDSYGFRSTFFFMSLNHGLSNEGRRYSVKNPRVAEVSKKLLEGGWEIGLHAAYHNHLSLFSLKEQKQRLEDVIREKITGCRHHYLRVRFPESWKIYAGAGLKYSSNMGWGEGFQGFRAGTCLPYQPLREHSLGEIPLLLMDRNPTTDIDGYMEMFNRYLEMTKRVGGCLVIDFHQEHFRDEIAPGVGKIYAKILDIIAKDQSVAVMTMNEVYNALAEAT
jgi:peptidoglycan/xylan/chitin deacetylase (PgdA/CDA1 family)